MISRRRGKRLGALLASASLAAMATAGVAAATTEPPGTEPTGTEAAAGGSGGVGEVGGSGCGIPHGPWEDDGVEPGGEVRVAWNDPLLSFNNTSSHGGATANTNPLYLMNHGQFAYYDGDLNFINNDSFGTCTIDSLDPLTVTYRINEGVTWSDGVPIDAADLVLNWAALSGVYNEEGTVITPEGDTAEADADGNPVIVDASGAVVPADAAFDEEGVLLEGNTYKLAAGVNFDGASESLSLVTQFPVISEDGLAATITWDSFYVDYQTTGLFPAEPAHVVAMHALAIEDPAEAKQALIDALQNDDSAAVKPIADFWNTGFDYNALPDDPSIYVGSGPYLLTSYDEVAQMTFEINPDYTWGPQSNVSTIVYTIIGDPTAAVQALANEEVDIIQPQATADILEQVNALADRGIEVLTGDGATYEHVDLVMTNGGPFDPATYGGDEAAALAVRQAFLKSIPRQEIVDRLIIPLNPDAIVRNSFSSVPGSPGYDDIVANNGWDALYAEVDIAGAEALLAEAGVTGPIDVRFLFADNNPRRANEYELIRDSAAQAGFNVIDGRSPTWGVDLSSGDLYDASLFGWQSTAIDVAGTANNFVTDADNNYGDFSNEELDAIYAELQTTTDPAAQQQLLTEAETVLWANGFGITLFQHPSVTALNGNYVSGVSNIALSPTLFWNFWEWQAA